MARIDLGEFENYTIKDYIGDYLKAATNSHIIDLINLQKERIYNIYEINPSQDYPDWFTESYLLITNEFHQIITNIRNGKLIAPIPTLEKFNKAIFSINKVPEFPNLKYSLPFLENYARSLKLQNDFKSIHSLYDDINSSFNAIKNQNDREIEKLLIQFNAIKAESENTLTLLNKEAGKIGVKNYAEIFQLQAYEHSSSNKKILDENQKEINQGTGKAQKWLTAGILLFVLLIVTSIFINFIFSLPNKEKFTPEDMVVIIGRVLLISSLIFLISFSFKQYRVNMHLYTLNKHRANTLKSFEYLTNAPDKLAPESYNAILMEVAKAIYESGQTGYINNSDSNSEMTSINDLTKIIHPAK